MKNITYDYKVADSLSVFKGGYSMKGVELEAFCKDMAILVRAGMTLEEVFEFMQQDSESNHIKEVIKEIKVELKNGKSIDEALQATKEFPQHMIYLIQIGVSTNQLIAVLEVLMEIYHREEELKQHLKRAINYPIYLCSIMCIIMLFLVLKVIPTFKQFFRDWTGEMTQGAKMFLNLGRGVGICTVVVFVFIVLLSIVSVLLVKTKTGRRIGYYLVGYTSIGEKASTAHFAWAMGILLQSGLSIEQGLSKSLGVVENRVVREKVSECLRMVKDKELFEYALVETKIFSRKITRLIIKSSKNNQLPKVMKEIGEESEKDLQYTLENKMLAIETFSVGVTSVVIGSILMTVMLPLISMLLMLM